MALTVAQSSVGGTGTGAGVTSFKNRLINGAFQINQRAVTTVPSTGVYTYNQDRWFYYSVGNTSSTALVSSPYGGVLIQPTSSAVTAIGIGQRIESVNCADLGSQTVTISCPMSMTGTVTTITWTLSYANTADTFGTRASPTVTQIATGTFTANGSTFSTTVTLPAQAINGLQLVFSCAPTSTFLWSVYTVQLEVGSFATTFGARPYPTELALCQRYYQNYSATSYRRYCQNVDRTPYPIPTTRVAGTVTVTSSTGSGVNALTVSCPTVNMVIVDIQFTAGGNGVVDFSSLGYNISAEL
jgi:hypothetical protein